MALKILLLLVVVLVVIYLLGMRRGGSKRAPRSSDHRSRDDAAQQPPQPMLSCAQCGVHLPRTEALIDGEGRGYCSEAHRLAGPG